MDWGLMFFVESVLLGIGLAMDAFSVSLANGLNEPCMKKGRMCAISWIFAVFQFAMPIIGWICVHTVAAHFKAFEKFIPWIALVLLCFIGGKMIYDGVNDDEVVECCHTLTLKLLFIQAIATSIDALSVGVSISNYKLDYALICVSIIALVTLLICFGAVFIGKKFGTNLGNKAEILGGIILIAIGIEIFITGLL